MAYRDCVPFGAGCLVIPAGPNTTILAAMSQTCTAGTVEMTLAREIRAFDMFCGAGGSSTGMATACDDAGVTLKLGAINHWDIAVATHSTNH